VAEIGLLLPGRSIEIVGMSRRAYARHRGCSEKAVRKAIGAGRITLEPDGSIDPEKADAQWVANTDPSRGGKISRGQRESRSGGPLQESRAAKMSAEAELAELKVRQMKGELIDKEKAAAEVFGWFRAERDAWLSWPARVSARMAADLKADHRTVHRVLEKYVRDHLLEQAAVEPPFED